MKTTVQVEIKPKKRKNPLLSPGPPFIIPKNQENQAEEEAENKEEIHLSALANSQVREFPRPRLLVIRIRKYWRG